MRLVLSLFIINGLIFWGCNMGPTEILIASKPSGAIVLMEGVEIGVTPMELKISKDSRVQVQKQGFLPYTEVLSKGGDPNLLIKLEKAQNYGVGLVSEDDLPNEGDLSSDAELVSLPGATPKQTENIKPRTYAKKTPRKSKRLTIAQVKQNYRTGTISKYTYKQQVHRLKSEMDRALRQLKERYRRGDFDKIEYEQRVRQTKYRYTG